MGGAVPLGYRVENRALHVVEDEAEFVRHLFRRYLEVGSGRGGYPSWITIPSSRASSTMIAETG